MSFSRARSNGSLKTLAILGTVVAVACGGGTEMAEEAATEGTDDPDTSVVDHLRAGHPIFGLFSGPQTPEQGAAMAERRPLDFVFYSLESGPFDLPTMEAFMAGMADASGDRGTHPVILRIPPIRDGHDEARDRAARGLATGVSGLVFPHVETVEEAELAVAAMGDGGWPANPDGHLLNLLLIEDQLGIDNVREIAQVPGVSAISPGPGDLARLYDRDMERVEEAIQIVLAACLEFDVICGITANENDVATRLEQGFRFIIATSDETIAPGMAAAGR